MSVMNDIDMAAPRREAWRPGKVFWGVLSFATGIGLWWLATVLGFS